MNQTKQDNKFQIREADFLEILISIIILIGLLIKDKIDGVRADQYATRRAAERTNKHK